MDFSFKKYARLMGRFDLSEEETPICGWVNSAVFLTFRGTAVNMIAEDSEGKDYVEIILDGIARNWINIKKGVHEYVIEQELQKRSVIATIC